MKPKTKLSAERVTLRDVARKLGVSHSTVSLCLRNHPSIPVARRDQVKRKAEEMGYRPDPWLSSLVAYRHGKRAVKIQSALAWVNHSNQPEQLRRFKEFDGYWRGAEASARRFGYHLEELRWTREFTAKRFEQILLTRNVRGLIIPPHHEGLDWADFDWSKFCLIRLGMSVYEPDSNLVSTDQHRAVVMAVTRIRDYGYQRIGFAFNEELDRRLGGSHLGGFAWMQRSLRLSPALPPLTDDSRVNAAKFKAAFKQWMERYRPDAILTGYGEIPGLLQELGYRVPQDVAVAGTSVDVPVDAGIDQRSEEIGRIAVEMLVKQININELGEPPAPCRILVESFWRDGKSLPRRTNK